MKRHLLFLACLLVNATALAASRQPQQQQPVQRRPPPCQGEAPQRYVWPNSDSLRGLNPKVAEDGSSTLLASVDLTSVRSGDAVLKGVHIQDGRLVAPPGAATDLVGALLKGTDSDGQSVEVALCGAQPDANDPAQSWYRIEIWNEESASWKSPCTATARVPSPRVLAVEGVWDRSGARQKVPGKFTFACETGAIAKCITWGYKPWAKKDGHSLEDLHQACTRMARADYCGNGRSHTRDDSPIDIYDYLQVLTRTRQKVPGWDPPRASFEAGWGPEGAVCLSRTRDGSAIETIRAECPGRFEAGEKDLGDGDRCTVLRKDAWASGALVRNRSYGEDDQNSLLGKAVDVTTPHSIDGFPAATSPRTK